MILLLIFLLFSQNINGANILFGISVISPSHQIWNYALASGLMEKGHNITMLGPEVNRNKPSDKYHPILLEGSEDHWDADPNEFLNAGVFKMMKTFSDLCVELCQHIYQSKSFNDFLKNYNGYKFDLIIFDVSAGPCLHPLIKVFNYPPTIGVTPFLLPPEQSLDFGNHLHPSYLPHYYLSLTDEMNFMSRVQNFIIIHMNNLKLQFERFRFNVLINERFGESMDNVNNLLNHVSLLLSNSNPIFDFPQPLPPNIIQVGGLHIKLTPLPKDLEEIMQNAKHGAIVFSLGTNVRSDKLDDKKIKIFLDVFSKLKQTVIWKFESQLKSLPKNVIIRKWLPQGALLGHPNTKLLITHGGALSIQEACHYGIPVIGIPFFVDQNINTLMIKKRKRGLYLDFNEITTEKLSYSIHEILENPIYSENMKNVSKQNKDLPMTPLEKAVFWSEYAMKHDGAEFLNTKARSMSYFVAESYDVIAFLLVLLLIIVFILCKLFLHIIKRITRFDSKTKIE